MTNKTKKLTLPRIFFTRGGLHFEGYPLPSNGLGSSMPYTSFEWMMDRLMA
jgi:hypothetical protein